MSAVTASRSSDSFPRLYARTGRFTLGIPRTITISRDGTTVFFVRTASGTDRSGILFSYDVSAGQEQVLADPAELLGAAGEELSDAERARRERARESGAGIVGYSIDDAGKTAVFALSGDLWVCDIASRTSRKLTAAGSVVDPRIDPTGRRIAYVAGHALRVKNVDGRADQPLAAPDYTDAEREVVWGQAEFIAAEELGRFRGFWWAPDGESLLVERYDNAPVETWFIADPAHPEREPVAHRYPAAGTANAEVSLWHVQLSGERREIPWDYEAYPYLATVSWSGKGALISVLSRDQRRAAIHHFDADLTPVSTMEQRDDDWLDVVPGLPALTADGAVITCMNDNEEPATRRLARHGVAFSPVGVQVEALRYVSTTGVIAQVAVEPTERHLARLGFDGSMEYLTKTPGVHQGVFGGPDGTTAVVSSSTWESAAAAVHVINNGATVGEIENLAAAPPFTARVTVHTVGELELRAGVIFPRDHVPGSRRLPVIMAPYGGPHAQLLLAAGRMFLQPQYIADQGFAVVVADGRGTPARGPVWERAVRDELAAVTLADQVAALQGVVELYPDDLDTGRVGIYGWSYGGYLAALAVLQRPDVFHAAVAGAPVTDWELYDTAYTERYLGDPRAQPAVYRRNSLIDIAGKLERPLLLIHGMVDDNVVVAHTLRLSAALLAAGKQHDVLPLTGITHMASDEVIAENLLRAQIDFLDRHLR